MAQLSQVKDNETMTGTAARRPDGHTRLAEPPPGPWWRTTMAGAVALILGLGLLSLIWIFARPLGFIILGFVIALAFLPIVNWLARWAPRGVAVVLVYLVIVLILAGLAWAVFPPLIDQMQQASQQLPQLADNAQQYLNNLPWVGNAASLGERVASQLGNLSSSLVSLPAQTLSWLIELGGMIFVSIYALIAAPTIHQFLLSLAPERSRGEMDRVLGKMSKSVGGYVRGVLIDAVLVGVITYIALLIIGVPFALVLGVISGVLEIIPNIGPVLAGIIMVAVALLQSPTMALIVLIFAIALQQVEGNILIPLVMQHETNISPLLAIIAVLLGASAGGVIGILVAIPLAAALRVLVLEAVVPAFRRWTGADPTPYQEAGQPAG